MRWEGVESCLCWWANGNVGSDVVFARRNWKSRSGQQAAQSMESGREASYEAPMGMTAWALP